MRRLSICVTGACGRIAYSLYSPLLSGDIFGHDVLIDLRLLDLSSKREELQMLKAQLEDCCFGCMAEVGVYDEKDLDKPFLNCDLVILLGGMPRRPGMDRNDVFETNAQIFKQQGRLINKAARPTCKCLVVANPTLTNCMVLAENAPNLLKANFTALTRLDFNRFTGQLAKLFQCRTTQLQNLILWGNHSRKQYCDVSRLEVEGLDRQVIVNKIAQLNMEQVEKVMYERGGFVQSKQGGAYLSATKAIIDHLKDWFLGSKSIVSMGIILDSEHYGVPAGLCYSMPTRCKGNGQYQVVEGLPLTPQQQNILLENRDELLKEKGIVGDFLTQS